MFSNLLIGSFSHKLERQVASSKVGNLQNILKKYLRCFVKKTSLGWAGILAGILTKISGTIHNQDQTMIKHIIMAKNV
jgi:hypothetical protein